jgi:hypothetical protein
MNDATSLIKKIDTLNSSEFIKFVREFNNCNYLSKVAKWFKHKCPKNSDYHKDMIVSIYHPHGGILDLETSDDPVIRELANAHMYYSSMVFQQVITAFNKYIDRTSFPSSLNITQSSHNHVDYAKCHVDLIKALFENTYKSIENDMLVSFYETIQQQNLDSISQVVASIGEDCLGYLSMIE